MGPGERTYHEQVDPITRDKRADVIPRSALRRQQIKLDNALVAQPFRIRGDVIFLDRNSTGIIQVQLNNTSEDLLPMGSGDSIAGLPFEDFFVTSAAQPGLIANMWYGYSARFRTFLVANDIIDRAARQLGLIEANPYGVSFKSTVALGANGVENIVAAAANLNGIRLLDVQEIENNTVAGASTSVLSKATAPATSIDGDVHLMNITFIGSTQLRSLPFPTKIPSGLRLDRFSAPPETSVIFCAKYTLL